MSTLAELYAAIKKARNRPRAIAVSIETWRKLEKAGVVEMKSGYGWGVFSTAERFPVFQRDIFVFVNPGLDTERKDFVMPAETDAPPIK